MQHAPLIADHIKAVIFDVIGTLVDEHRAWASAAQRLALETGTDDTDNLLASWTQLLDRRMAAVVAGGSAWRPHRELIRESAAEAISSAGGDASAADLQALQFLDGEYPVWPDVPSATAELRRTRLVAGLSNGDLDALARLANGNRISWDVVLSAGTVRTFKPAPAAYRYAIDALRVDPSHTLFVAAHPWDLRAAAHHGFRTAYVARPGAERPSEADRFDLEVADVLGLVAYFTEGSD